MHIRFKLKITLHFVNNMEQFRRIYIYIYIYIYCIKILISLSFSLYIYIYVYIYLDAYVCVCSPPIHCKVGKERKRDKWVGLLRKEEEVHGSKDDVISTSTNSLCHHISTPLSIFLPTLQVRGWENHHKSQTLLTVPPDSLCLSVGLSTIRPSSSLQILLLRQSKPGCISFWRRPLSLGSVAYAASFTCFSF